MKLIRKLLSGILLLGFATLLIHGCNTMEGLGEDIESGGESIQEAAD